MYFPRIGVPLIYQFRSYFRGMSIFVYDGSEKEMVIEKERNDLILSNIILMDEETRFSLSLKVFSFSDSGPPHPKLLNPASGGGATAHAAASAACAHPVCRASQTPACILGAWGFSPDRSCSEAQPYTP